jgi:hypothetical protein
MKPDSKKLSNPQSIEDVLMQCGAYGSSDSKYIADSIRAWLNSRPIDPKAFEAERKAMNAELVARNKELEP